MTLHGPIKPTAGDMNTHATPDFRKSTRSGKPVLKKKSKTLPPRLASWHCSGNSKPDQSGSCSIQPIPRDVFTWQACCRSQAYFEQLIPAGPAPFCSIHVQQGSEYLLSNPSRMGGNTEQSFRKNIGSGSASQFCR